MRMTSLVDGPTRDIQSRKIQHTSQRLPYTYISMYCDTCVSVQ